MVRQFRTISYGDLRSGRLDSLSLVTNYEGKSLPCQRELVVGQNLVCGKDNLGVP